MHRAIAVCLAVGVAAAQPVRLTVNTPIVTHAIDQRIYGQTVDATIWGEAVRNPKFAETLTQGAWRAHDGILECAGPAGRFRLPAPGDYELTFDVRRGPGGAGDWHSESRRVEKGSIQAWVLTTDHGPAQFRNLKVTTLDGHPLFTGVPLPAGSWYAVGPVEVAGHRVVTRDSGATLEQHGISVRAGDTLRGTLRLQGLTQGVKLGLVDGATVIASQDLPAAEEMPLALTPAASASDATLQIVLPGHSDLTLEQILLMPDSARATGGFRPDLLQALTALRPPIVRWSAADWKTEAFSVDQFLALAEKLGSQPVIAIPSSVPAEDAEELVRRCGPRVKYFDRGGLVSEWNAETALQAGGVLINLELDSRIAMAAPATPIRPPAPVYTVMKLFRDHFATDALQMTGDAGAIDAIATGTPDGHRIYVKLVNRKAVAMPVELGLRGDFPLLAAEMQVVAGERPGATAPIERAGLVVRFSMPRESVAVVTLSR